MRRWTSDVVDYNEYTQLNSILDNSVKSTEIYVDLNVLLIYPFVEENDIYRFLELKYNTPGYVKERIFAEKKVKKNNIFVDYLSIYSNMNDCYKFMQDIEKKERINLVSINYSIIQLLDELKRFGKKIFLLNDTLLTAEMVDQIFNNNLLNSYDIISLSDINSSKIEYLNNRLEDHGHANELFYIGLSMNNHITFDCSDVNYAKIMSPIDWYKDNYPYEYSFYLRKKSLSRSIVVSLDMLYVLKNKNELWYDLGYRYGGPMIVAYFIFINNHWSHDSKLFFIARDGYTLKKVFEKIYPNEDFHYIYAQRIFLSMLVGNKIPLGKTFRLEKDTPLEDIRSILYFCRKSLLLDSVPDSDEELLLLYNTNINKIDSCRITFTESYKQAMLDEIGEENISIVDCTTTSFSSRNIMEQILNKKIKSYYFVCLSNPDERSYIFFKRKSPIFRWIQINLPEFFMSSPEHPVSGWVDGKPVFQSDCINGELLRSLNYDKLSDGEVDYSQKLYHLFGSVNILDYATVIRWAEIVTEQKSQYYDLLDRVCFSSNPTHSDNVSLVSNYKNHLMIIKKIINNMKK